ncbi:single-stranded RNA 5'-_3' exonuclease, partial [Haematococcus lacustris]
MSPGCTVRWEETALGIPKFYRWLSERYPLLNQKVTATEGPPEIDNLYLDMNGIIHNCTHANQREIKLGEDDMMLRIFDYIDKLIQIIKPQKLLFMAIDGCAPRAKMNQQRSRRFKSAKEAEE